MPAPDFSRQLDVVSPEYQERATGVLSTLQSYFLEMPRGGSFCEREDFERAYRVFSEKTEQGRHLTGEALIEAMEADPRVWLVLRAAIGMSPGEMAYVASRRLQRPERRCSSARRKLVTSTSVPVKAKHSSSAARREAQSSERSTACSAT